MAATEIRRLFVPFGELVPDGKLFNNNGLVQAKNVAPVHGNYVACQLWTNKTAAFSGEPLGLHPHFTGTTWKLYYGDATKLYEVDPTAAFPWVPVDKSRLVGGAYATTSTGGEYGWQATSFGDSVVMTNYVDDPQLLTSPAAGNFVKLAQSGSGNPGMDPKAKFAFPVRNNLFLANLNLAAGFDGLPAGANPTVVCWSQSDNVRQYGSYNVTPELIGTGYQPLSYDYGYITGGVGGDYALIALQAGWVRCDGPPYTFRPIVAGVGCRYPSSIVRFDQDVYFWGPAGPSVLRGGEGPVETLGTDKVTRTLLDNSTGFSPSYSINSAVDVQHVSVGIDTINGLVIFSYTSVAAVSNGAYSQAGDLSILYNVADGRFSFVENRVIGLGTSGITHLRTGPDLGLSWAPGRDLIGVGLYDNVGSPLYVLAAPTYEVGGGANPLLQRAYQQLDPDRTTRIRRVRPIYSKNMLEQAVAVGVSIASKNRPYEDATATTFSALDNHGWVTTPTAKYADFHQVSVTLASVAPVIAEMEGYEVEYELGGAYSA